MTQISSISGDVRIERQLKLVGRKYRAQRMLRGGMLFAGFVLISTVLAAFLAHRLGQGLSDEVVAGILGVANALAFWQWIICPAIRRPAAWEIARLIESRIDGLHDGLTNSLLLARREDIAASPWLPQIYDEIARAAQDRPLRDAVRFRELRPAARRMLYVALPAIAAAVLMPVAFLHGWQQLLHPVTFIPRVGSAQILDVQPKDVTLIAGQPLEINVRARASGAPAATLVFDLPAGATATEKMAVPQTVQLPAVAASSSASDVPADLEYGYRVDRLERPLRYRVEVAGTQSPWYRVTIVPEVTLVSLDLTITPPAYTGLAGQVQNIPAAAIATRVITVPQGSEIAVGVKLDVPVSGAMLQRGDAAPVPMTAFAAGESYVGKFPINQDTPVVILITDGAKQIIARVPDQPLLIHCVTDLPPAISMKWPTQDTSVAPDAALKVSAMLRDDYGVTAGRVLMSVSNRSHTPEGDPAHPPVLSTQPSATGAGDSRMVVVYQQAFGLRAGVQEPIPFEFELQVPALERVEGNVIRVQVEAVDNRNLGTGDISESGPQTMRSPIYEIKFQNPAALAKQQKDSADALHDRLEALLKQQLGLYVQSGGLRVKEPAQFDAAKNVLATIAAGQSDLRDSLQSTAQTFPFAARDRVVQKTLLMLALEPATDAVNSAGSLKIEPVVRARPQLLESLRSSQRTVISTLQSLLGTLGATPEPATLPATQPAQRPHEDLTNKADQFKKLDEALKQFEAQQQKILDQTAGLAKKPVDQWDDNDRKALDELKMAQEKLDAFMEQKVSDFSKNSDQDMSNSSLLKDLAQIFSETTMAKEALNQQAVEIAVADEDNGLELAKELSSNIEKWLGSAPDRTKWTQEDPAGKTDTPMPELPKDLADIVGQLLEQEEDLFDKIEDANANWADSADKAVGMDAADGPIADMSAKGVTGNTLPNNNEMNGRAGEGRQGKSQGEFVGDTAEGKGGRGTPTRLDPTPFTKGQVKDNSKDPTGGATGGGKLSGEGGEGLEGPVPPKVKATMQRLADKQAALRNTAERLNLQYHLDRYDNFKLAESVALMRRVESDLQANRYSNALRHRDVTLDDLDTSRLLLGGEVHVQQDTTPKVSQKLRSDLNDAMKGELPPAWSEALKAYYQKLGEE